MDRVYTYSCNKLGEIKVPTLVVVGTKDIVTSPANSLSLIKGIPGYCLIQIWKGGLGVMFQYPEDFTNAIKVFLESTSPHNPILNIDFLYDYEPMFILILWQVL